MAVLATEQVVLASASRTRVMLLENAGLTLAVDPAHVDEATIRESLEAERAKPADIAAALAELKAVRVSARHPSRLVIGADQILTCEGKIHEKPMIRARAAEQLRALAGKTHELVSAAAVARDGAILWRHVESAAMTMRPLSERFISAYLDAAGDSVLGNVGSYALEGLGAQLFSRIQGDYFVVLGLPLLPLLDFLREHHILSR